MRGILFDLDETLLDRTSSLKDFVLHQAEMLVPLEKTMHFLQRFLELDANGSVWKDQVYSCLIDEFSIRSANVDDLVQDYLLTFKNFCKPRAGAESAITEFSGRDIPLGLISNGLSPFQENNFSALGFEGKFRTIVVSDAVGIRKPDPLIFHLACDQLQSDPARTIFVGDNPVADIQGAKSAGLKTVYIPGYFGAECPDADALCTHLSELPDIADNLWKK